jgi:UDP-3-O-[3-hydroxymyristoyl] N-acetylglucosamine deacetylase/3-hydroxyacyl-[acyl-carrier-protein] dehydratase
MTKQKTIKEEISFSGIGVHTGSLTTVTFKPAPPNSGVVFYRTDLPGKPAIPANIDHVIDVSRGTTIGIGDAIVHTVEHALSALVGLGVDNLSIELDGEEIPNGDGSAMPVMTTLMKVGTVDQDAEKKFITVDKPVYYRQDDVTLSILPSDELRISMTIAYDHVAIGTQYASFVISPDTFKEEIAPARTFCFLSDVKMLQEQGLIKGGSLESAVVIGEEGILNDDLRFTDEFVRHKILDLLGDMFLLGLPVKGHVVAVKSGHEKNVMFSRQIMKAYTNGHDETAANGRRVAPTQHPPALDVRQIMKVIPHRYPFLLVDRILSYVALEHATGIKNVSMNEPFFQGHWPGTPVMPGVLIIEAMAQVSSVIIFGEDAPKGRLAYFMGVDRAKFRRTVIPGDQLVIECTMLRYRPNACKVKGTATVDGMIAAEAVMTFGLVKTES